MAKASSPIRLDADLMKEAKLAGSINRRSQAEQIEYWASIGRSVDGLIDPGTLIEIKSGVTSISLNETSSVSINPDDVFGDLENMRQQGTLAESINRDYPVYQASANKEGYLERIELNGEVSLGTFIDGKFISKD